MGDAKVSVLPRARDEQAARVISILEEALEFSRENPCSGVSVFLMGRDGMNHFLDGTESRSQAVGALAMMQHQLMASD